MDKEKRPTDENITASDGQAEAVPTKKRRKLKGFEILFIVIAVLAALAVAFTSIGILYVKKNFNYKYNEITNNPEVLGFEEVKDTKIVNIALFGIDTTKVDSFSGRSDSIMILSINTTDKKIKLISVLRDSFVPIERKSYTEFSKINSAYAKGGPELAIKTLNHIFNLDISEYATVNFYGMADIIDTLGGIDAEITAGEVSELNAGIRLQCSALKIDHEPYIINNGGKQHLNGIQAVSYSRIRHVANAQGTSNDYGRTDRQRYVLEQLFKKVSSQSKTSYINLIKKVSPYCETSLSYTEILSLAVEVLLNSPTFEETRVPFVEYTMKAPQTNAGSIVYYDLNFAANIVHSFIYENVKPDDFIALNGIEKNDWYASGYMEPKIVSYEERKKQKQNDVAESAPQVSDSDAATPN